MPKLWNATIETHRAAVRDAILDATLALVAERGLRGVTMAKIAARAGIGRATLYKYFGDAEAVLRAWHEREIGRHLADVGTIADGPGEPAARLSAVLERYALNAQAGRGGHDAEMAAVLHRDEQVAAARHRLRRLVAGLIAEAAAAGAVRDDVAPDELAAYGLAALGAAGELRSPAAVRRLVAAQQPITLVGARPASAQLIATQPTSDVAKHEHGDDNVIQRAEDRDELRDEIDGVEQPRQQADEGGSCAERDGAIDDEPADEAEDVRDDADELTEPNLARPENPKQSHNQQPHRHEADEHAPDRCPVHHQSAWEVAHQRRRIIGAELVQPATVRRQRDRPPRPLQRPRPARGRWRASARSAARGQDRWTHTAGCRAANPPAWRSAPEPTAG